MHRPCSVPFLQPHITVCPNGCVHLQIGPAIVIMSTAGLRALAELAQKAVDTLGPAADTGAEIADPPRSIN